MVLRSYHRRELFLSVTQPPFYVMLLAATDDSQHDLVLSMSLGAVLRAADQGGSTHAGNCFWDSTTFWTVSHWHVTYDGRPQYRSLALFPKNDALVLDQIVCGQKEDLGKERCDVR